MAVSRARKGSGFRDFVATFGKSVYSPAFYASVPAQSNGQALAYFFKLAIVLALILMAGSSGLLIGIVKFERNLPSLVARLSDNFPAELTVTFKGGHASANVPQPYFVPKQAFSGATASMKHALVIDTKTPFSSEQFAKYQSYAWLTQDSLFYYGSYNSQTQPGVQSGAVTATDIRVLPLSNVSDMTINQAKVHGWLAMFEPWVRWLTPVFALVVVGFLYVAVLTKLIYLFILACLVFAVGGFLRLRLSYGAAYRIGLYAASLGFGLSELAGAVKFHVPTYSVTILTLGLVILNLRGQPRKTV